jgi:hypothetical protein
LPFRSCCSCCSCSTKRKTQPGTRNRNQPRPGIQRASINPRQRAGVASGKARGTTRTAPWWSPLRRASLQGRGRECEELLCCTHAHAPDLSRRCNAVRSAR